MVEMPEEPDELQQVLNSILTDETKWWGNDQVLFSNKGDIYVRPDIRKNLEKNTWTKADPHYSFTDNF